MAGTLDADITVKKSGSDSVRCPRLFIPWATSLFERQRLYTIQRRDAAQTGGGIDDSELFTRANGSALPCEQAGNQARIRLRHRRQVDLRLTGRNRRLPSAHDASGIVEQHPLGNRE